MTEPGVTSPGFSADDRKRWTSGPFSPQPVVADADTSQDDARAALRACAAGDASALRSLYDKESPRMMGVALRILRRREMAEDVVHDAFLRIWRAAGSYDPALGSPRAWMYAIVRNLAISMLRDGRREDLADDARLAELSDAGLDPAPIERLAEGSALRRCLERLDPKRRESLLLAYANGYSHGEIAGKLGVPLGTIKAWIRRSLSALRECMA